MADPTGLDWTETQLARFKDLDINSDKISAGFTTPEERNKAFQKIEKQHARIQREKLSKLLDRNHKTGFQLLRDRLENALFDLGFTGVSTPTIISRHALKKMGIGHGHPLNDQVFWLNDKQCLRPMLAPNLYSLMQDFGRLNHRPIGFFEMGSCFRKESSGAVHSNEFTMLNLVEMGVPENDRHDRLRFLADTVMGAAGIKEYVFVSEDSEVYGDTLDVEAGPDRIEVASGAMGPHELDGAWGITDTWVGMGFGLERLLMISKSDNSIGRWSKSIASIDGIRLKL